MPKVVSFNSLYNLVDAHHCHTHYADEETEVQKINYLRLCSYCTMCNHKLEFLINSFLGSVCRDSDLLSFNWDSYVHFVKSPRWLGSTLGGTLNSEGKFLGLKPRLFRIQNLFLDLPALEGERHITYCCVLQSQLITKFCMPNKYQKHVWLIAGIKVEIPHVLKEGSFIYLFLIDIYVNKRVL